MNLNEVKEQVRVWAAANVAEGVTVVFANQNAPRPALPYVTIHVTAMPEKEHASVGPPDENGDAEIVNDLAPTVSLQAFGDGARDIMSGLRRSLDKVTVLQSLRAAGLPFIRDLSGVTDLSETVGTKFEDRAGLDLEFRAAGVVTDAVGAIESVEGTATHETGENIETNVNYQIGV